MDKTVSEMLATATASEKLTIKAQALVDSKIADFEMDGYSVSFLSQPKMNGNLVECEIAVTKDGKEIWIDNPVQFLNPPVNVPDGTTRKELDSMGAEIESCNMKFDPQEALKIILVRVVKHFDK